MSVGVKEGCGVIVWTSVDVAVRVGAGVMGVDSAGGRKFSAMGGVASSLRQPVPAKTNSRMSAVRMDFQVGLGMMGIPGLL